MAKRKTKPVIVQDSLSIVEDEVARAYVRIDELQQQIDIIIDGLKTLCNSLSATRVDTNFTKRTRWTKHGLAVKI